MQLGCVLLLKGGAEALILVHKCAKTACSKQVNKQFGSIAGMV
jgi:hypothetical protein